MFATSIFENIRYGNPGASREEVEQAAKEANAHEFISGFADGYDTVLGERGMTLSGGQRQRYDSLIQHIHCESNYHRPEHFDSRRSYERFGSCLRADSTGSNGADHGG